ncbi:hypothetical protein D3C71_1685380 [compost metagenome]
MIKLRFHVEHQPVDQLSTWFRAMVNNIGALWVDVLQRQNFSQLSLSGNMITIDFNQLLT